MQVSDNLDNDAYLGIGSLGGMIIITNKTQGRDLAAVFTVTKHHVSMATILVTGHIHQHLKVGRSGSMVNTPACPV